MFASSTVSKTAQLVNYRALFNSVQRHFSLVNLINDAGRKAREEPAA